MAPNADMAEWIKALSNEEKLPKLDFGIMLKKALRHKVVGIVNKMLLAYVTKRMKRLF